MADPNEMVIVHVDDGTRRGHDRKFTRKEAETFLTYTPNARIVGDDATSAEDAPSDEMAAEDPSRPARRSSVKKNDKPAEPDPAAAGV